VPRARKVIGTGDDLRRRSGRIRNSGVEARPVAIVEEGLDEGGPNVVGALESALQDGGTLLGIELSAAATFLMFVVSSCSVGFWLSEST